MLTPYTRIKFDEATPTSSASGTKKRRSGLLLIIGYVLLVLSMVVLDQTTKFHAEKNFLVSSHPTDIHSIQRDYHRVMTLGVSPSYAADARLDMQSVSNNWLDFHLTYVRNTGVAWGFMSNIPEPYRLPFFSTITLGALGVILYLLRSTHPGQRMARAAYLFILAGAAGNFVDRVLLGYVIDWIQFHWKIFGWEYSFPVFNVADISINIGVGLMILDLIITDVLEARQKKRAAATV